MNLRNKRILITAGPTWVPIDKVRVISNTATGETGILLANKLQKLGAQITLLLGPIGQVEFLDNKIKTIYFKFFEQFKNIILKELRNKKYHIVIHSAAVSDYRLKKSYSYKVKSGIKQWQINLIPTEKIINCIKKLDRNLFLVGFKSEPDLNGPRLINEAKFLRQEADLDLVVANTLKDNKYQAYIINQKHTYGPLFSRKTLVDKLLKIIGETYGTTENNR